MPQEGPEEQEEIPLALLALPVDAAILFFRIPASLP